MIRKIIFDENGNYVAFDVDGQVAAEQGNAWLEILQDKLDRKAIDLKTKVIMPGWWTPDHKDRTWTVGELLKSNRLKARAEIA